MRIADLRLFILQSQLRFPEWGGIEAAHPTAIGRYPIDTAPSFEQIVDKRMGQAVFDAIGGEFVAVESAEPFPCAEPEETMRVPNDALNVVARQSVGSRVSPHRQLLGPRDWRQRH